MEGRMSYDIPGWRNGYMTHAERLEAATTPDPERALALHRLADRRRQKDEEEVTAFLKSVQHKRIEDFTRQEALIYAAWCVRSMESEKGLRGAAADAVALLEAGEPQRALDVLRARLARSR